MESQLPDVFQYVLAPLPVQFAAIDGTAAAMQNATASVQQQVFALFIILFLSFAS